MIIRLPSIFFFIKTIDSKNNNKIHKVNMMPIIDLLYKFAPIDTQIIIPGILDKQ